MQLVLHHQCCVWFDSIQMMFLNVVMSMHVLSTTNDLDKVGAINGFADDGDRKPQVPGINEERYGLVGEEWRFLVAASLVMVLCTVGSTLVKMVTLSIGMWISVILAGITFLQVNASKHCLACYSMLVELSMGLGQSPWHR